ncbi:MAG: peptide ABC transporter substrate-binding protein [Candidatus Hydrogenedentes bacterium]|nr:peptide ABC transporter substrate-binding protein [Candidatus Hydrogenedentota bacterium]
MIRNRILYLLFYFSPLSLFIISCSENSFSPYNNLRIGNGAEVQDLDPSIVSGVTEHRVLSALFEGLVSLDPKTLNPIPGVAESWEISNNNLLYTFKIRKNAFWSNGEPLTANDFVSSWKRILTPSLSAEYAYLLFCLKNAKAFYEKKIQNFDEVGVKAIDDYTLQVELEYPTLYFLTMQSHNIWFPVHLPTLEKFGDPYTRSNKWTRSGNHVSNGAYRLVKWIPNKIVLLEKNPYYWNKESVRIHLLSFYPIDNQLTEERLFRTSYLDLTSTVPLKKIDFYKNNRPGNLLLFPYVGVYYYRINVTKPPLNNPYIRKALSLSIDRKKITEFILRGGEQPAYHYVPPGLGDYKPPQILEYNPILAKQLLSQAGIPDGKSLPPIEILFNTSEAHKTIAEAVQRMWKENLGIDVRLLNQDWKVYLVSMNQLDYQVARSAWIADFLDPINFLECFLSYSGNNRTGWNNPEFDKKIELAYREANSQERLKLLEEAEKILLEELPIIPIYFYTQKMLISERVVNFQPNVLGYIRWQDLGLR